MVSMVRRVALLLLIGAQKSGTRTATNVGDEGGFAPNVQTAEEALDILAEAIEKAGYTGKISILMFVRSLQCD